jgi:pimeloyl-ACP methyl ester carboxylesterase
MRQLILFLAILLSGCMNGEIEDINGDIKEIIDNIEVKGKGYQVTDVTLTTSDGITINGTYYNTSEEGSPGVILLHMLSRNRNDWQEFARDLQDLDYRVLAIDLRGHGESDLDWKEFMPGEGFTDMLMDVTASKEYLLEEGTGEKDIVIIGGSIGSNLALNYAAGDKDIKGVVLLSPGLDYRGVQTEETMVAYGERPIFIIASEGDTYSADSSRKLYSLAKGDAKIKIYPADAHGTWILQSQNSGEMILEWVQEVL